MTKDLHLCSKYIVYTTYPSLFIKWSLDFHIFIFQLICKIIRSGTIKYFRNISALLHIHITRRPDWRTGLQAGTSCRAKPVSQLSVQQSASSTTVWRLSRVERCLYRKRCQERLPLEQAKENTAACCLLHIRHTYSGKTFPIHKNFDGHCFLCFLDETKNLGSGKLNNLPKGISLISA